MIEQNKKERAKLTILSLYNFFSGILLVAYIQSINDFIVNGLWHKVINVGFNLPIGMLSMSILSILIAYIFSLTVTLNYGVYKKGINFIKIKGES